MKGPGRRRHRRGFEDGDESMSFCSVFQRAREAASVAGKVQEGLMRGPSTAGGSPKALKGHPGSPNPMPLRGLVSLFEVLGEGLHAVFVHRTCLLSSWRLSEDL